MPFPLWVQLARTAWHATESFWPIWFSATLAASAVVARAVGRSRASQPHSVLPLPNGSQEWAVPVGETLEAAGGTRVEADELGNSSHPPGTRWMGNDCGTSVVDAWGRSRAVPHLLVPGGSVFALAAAVNPAPTVSALATGVADEVIAAFRRGDLR